MRMRPPRLPPDILQRQRSGGHGVADAGHQLGQLGRLFAGGQGLALQGAAQNIQKTQLVPFQTGITSLFLHYTTPIRPVQYLRKKDFRFTKPEKCAIMGEIINRRMLL